VLLRQEILLGGKHIKRAMYRLLIWENFGADCSNILGGKTS
jgi:hypothetical protein